MNNIRYFIIACLLPLLIISCNAQKSKPFDYSKGDVEEFNNSDFNMSELTFAEISTVKSDIDGNGVEDVISFYNCEGWENDPGNFRKVVVKLNNGKAIEFINREGWINLPEGLRNQSKFNEFILINNEVPILALIGYPYASEPGYLNLISLNGEATTVVVNQKFDLTSIERGKSQISLDGTFKDKSSTITVDPSGLKFKR